MWKSKKCMKISDIFSFFFFVLNGSVCMLREKCLVANTLTFCWKVMFDRLDVCSFGCATCYAYADDYDYCELLSTNTMTHHFFF